MDTAHTHVFIMCCSLLMMRTAGTGSCRYTNCISRLFRYAAFRFFPRQIEFSAIVLRGGALVQPYIVDIFLSTDQNYFLYLR
ncbi:hypothetical protein DFH29DRAFT_280414 [Suillus ampliporus]|nr:hypothetical protein DFH29DRAFT_280414 [Suillus ampliporus]